MIIAQTAALAEREFEFEVDLTLFGLVIRATGDLEASAIVHAMTPQELVAATRVTIKRRVVITTIGP
jgi:hypothetical protein